MIKLRIALLSFLIIQTFLPIPAALADTGPKPSMEFTFTGEAVTITSGLLFECEQPDCSDAASLEELGPQGFRCDAQSCSAVAYGFAPYHKLEIQFSDGRTLQSNIFATAGFESTYKVTVRPDDLLVEAQLTPGNIIPVPRVGSVAILCACVAVLGVVAIGFVIFLFRRRANR